MLRWKSLFADRLTKGLRRKKRSMPPLTRRLFAETLEDRRMLAAVAVSNASEVVDGNVSSITDLINNPGSDGTISLREAIQAANATTDADQITFNSTVFASLQSIKLRNQLPTITQSLTITGPATGGVTLDADGGDFRIFLVDNLDANNQIDVELSNLTLTGANLLAINDYYAVGGGILNRESLTIQDSTLSGNSANFGGGIYNDQGNLTITNSTLSGNSARGGIGGAIYNRGSATIENSTITNNTATMGGGIYQKPGFSTTISNSIIAGNIGPDISGSSDSVSGSFNLIGDGTGLTNFTNGANGNLVGTSADPINPRLAPLASNGGPTQTHAFFSGSPAINAGDPAAVAGVGNVPQFDQRGNSFARVRDGIGSSSSRIDMGAYEAQSPPASADVTLDASLNLVIADLTPNGVDDQIELSVIGTNLMVKNPGQQFSTDIPDATNNGPNELLIPLSTIDGKKVIVNSNAGKDTLTVDFGTALSLQLDVEFNGGDPSASPGDKLVLTGGTFETATHTFTTTGPGKSGQIAYQGGGTTTTIVYTGLEPVDMSGSTITNLVFNLPGTADMAILEDDGIDANGISQIRSQAGKFETTTFSNTLLTSLRINLGTDDGTLAVASLPDFTATLIIDGQEGTDSVVFQGTINLSNASADLNVLQAEAISDASGANIQVNDAAIFNAGTGLITLADNASDALQIGGLATFMTSGAVTVGGAGTANFGSLAVTGGDVTITEDSALVLTALTATGMATITAMSPLTIMGNVSVGANSIFTATDSAAIGDDLTITAGVTIDANGNDLTFNAGDNFSFAVSAAMINAANVIVNVATPDANTPESGSAVSFAGSITATQLTLNGGDDSDTFLVIPSVDTPIQVNGGDPTTAPGDRLIVRVGGIADASVPAGSPIRWYDHFYSQQPSIDHVYEHRIAGRWLHRRRHPR